MQQVAKKPLLVPNNRDSPSGVFLYVPASTTSNIVSSIIVIIRLPQYDRHGSNCKLLLSSDAPEVVRSA